SEGEQEDADPVAEEQRRGDAPVGGTRQGDRRQACHDRRREQWRHEELAGEGEEVRLAAERQRAEDEARTVLEEATQAALGPPKPLAPERPKFLDGLLGH